MLTEPPFGAVHECGFAAVVGAPGQVLCMTVPLAWARGVRGFPGMWLDAAAALKERDAGERGQPVHQLVLESGVAGL
jgi:hypothetical protein